LAPGFVKEQPRSRRRGCLVYNEPNMVLPELAQKIGKPSFIDILVSLAVFGFLVVLVLAYINPLERLRRNEDAKTYQAAQKLAEALRSYENQRQSLPWQDTQEEDSPSDSNKKPQQSWLAVLESNGLLEKNLGQFTNLKEYLVVNTSPQKVCFYPQSVEFRKQGKYDESGINECLPEGFTPCYICFEY